VTEQERTRHLLNAEMYRKIAARAVRSGAYYDADNYYRKAQQERRLAEQEDAA
jgi:hypothetical protein